MSYQLMANLYDQFMQGAPYEKWVEFTENMIKKNQLQVKNIVDLGCGTGEITIKLANKGYTVTGVDNSTDMLSIAAQKATDHHHPIKWIHQDLRKLQGLTEYDLAISYCDVINYITDPNDLQTVFTNVANTLKENGLFLFDIHSVSHVENDLVGNTFADVTEDNAYIWFCYPGDTVGEMYHELTFFSSNGETYTRFDETHHQQTYALSKYQDLLKMSGLEILSVYADFSIENQFSEDEAERIFIIAQKRTR